MKDLRRRALAVATAVLTAVGLATVISSPAEATGLGHCTSSGGTVTCTFGFSGTPDTVVVPAGVTSVHVEAIGARGGFMQHPYSALVSQGDGVPA